MGTKNKMSDLNDFGIDCSCLLDYDKRTQFFASWETDDHRFHVWLYRKEDGTFIRPAMIYKNKKTKERNDKTQYLRDNVDKNKRVINTVIARCTPDKLAAAIEARKGREVEDAKIARARQISYVTEQARELGFTLIPITSMRCNKCHRPMEGGSAYDGACECGGLIEVAPQCVT